MIEGFENITHELTDYEKNNVMPRIVEGFKRIGAEPTPNSKIIAKLTSEGYKVSAPRIRKIIHEIRVQGLIPNLISNSKGYFISSDPVEIINYIESLGQRVRSISEIGRALKEQLKGIKQTKMNL